MSEPWRTPSDAELVRYLAGGSDPTEAHAIERWLEAAPEHRQRLEDLHLVWQGTEPQRPAWDRERSWERLAGRLEPVRRPELVRESELGREAGSGRKPEFGREPELVRESGLVRGPALAYERPGVRGGRWRHALIAAGFGAVLAAGWYVEQRLAGSRADGPVAAAPMTERRTGPGERASFRLADGSGVMLGPASRLRYSAASYGRGARAVELEGDGYFEVVHDEARPFVVRTSTALIRDLGTRFVVRARPGERRVDVGVAEGRVAVGRAATPADSIVLDPGDAAWLAEGAGQPVVQRGVNLDRYFAWTEGRLVFERAPMPVVVDELERWYDVEIELAGRGLEGRVLTAAFRDKPVAEVLALVAASLDLRVSGGGKRFVVSAR